MCWYVLTPDDVILIHEQVIKPHELQGLAQDKSLEGALARVNLRVQYGMISDLYDLAATYAVVIATGHLFNDANKRTAFRTMQTCLHINNVNISFEIEEVGRQIINVAQGLVNEVDLAEWLRRRSS